MDLAELGIVFVTEGAEAAIAKQQAYLDISEQVITSVDDATKAHNKLIASQETLSGQINRSIISYQGSKAAQYEFAAIAMGTNDQLDRQIELLKTHEMYSRLMTDAINAENQAIRNEQGYLMDLAKDIEHLNKVKAKEAADAETARKNELASRDAYYKKITADAKAAEQAIIDAKHKAILDAQDATAKAAAMYTKEEQDRVKAVQKAEAQIAAEKKKAADDATKDAERKALSEISWAAKSRDEQLRIKDQIAAYRGAGVSDASIANTFGPAAMTGTIKEVDNLADKWNKVSLNTSRARSEMVVLAHEAVQGRFSRIPASLMVLAEYSDITALALSGVGLSIMSVVAASIIMSVGMIKGMLEQKGMQDALVMTGNYAGTTSAALDQMAHTAVAAGGSLAETKEVMTKLAASGKYTAEQILTVGTAVSEVAHATNMSEKEVDSLVKQFESLQVQAGAHARYSDAIAKATLKLDDQYHFLTSSVLTNIQALEEEGKAKEASAVATDAFAKALEERSQEIVANLGLVEKAWNAIKEAAGGAKSAVGDWGKKDTYTSQLEDAKGTLATLLERQARKPVFGPSKEDIDEAVAQVRYLAQVVAREQEDAIKAGEKARIQSIANHATTAIEANTIKMKADNLGQLTVALKKYHEQLDNKRAAGNTAATDPQLDPEAIRLYEAGLAKMYKETKVAAVKEASRIILDEQIREQNQQYSSGVQQLEKMAALERKGFTNTVQIENDRFAILRSNSQKENEMGITEAQEYVKHYEIIKTAAEIATARQHSLSLIQIADAEARLEKIKELVAAQPTLTDRGNELDAKAISKAEADLQAVKDKAYTELQAARANQSMEIAKAAADTQKMENAELNTAIEKMTKKVAKEKEHLATLLFTKVQLAEIAEKDDESFGKKLEKMLVEAQFQKAQADGDIEKLRMYDLEIAKLERLINLRKDSADIQGQTATAQIDKETAKLAEDAWKKSWHSIDKFGQEVFSEWASGGENMAKKIGETLKKALLEAIYVATIKPLVFQMYSSVMGGASSAAMGSAAGSAAGGSMAGSMGGGLLGTSGTLFSAGMQSTMANGMISGFGTNMANIGMNLQAGAYSQALGTAMPYVGAIIAGYSILKNLGVFGSNFTSSSNIGGSQKGFSAAGGVLSSGSVGGQTAMADDYINSIGASYQTIAKALGIGTVQTGFGYYSNNGREAQNPNFQLNASAGGKTYQTVSEDPGLYGSSHTAITKEHLALEASRAVLTALQASEIPKYLSNVFSGITAGSATQDQINTALNFASSLKQVRDAMSETRTPIQILRDTVKSGMEALETSATTFKTDFVAAIDKGLTAEQVSKWQALGTSLEQLGNTAYDQAKSLDAAADSIRKLVQNISKSVSDSIFDMKYGMQNDAGKYNMLDVKGDKIDKDMRAATSIQEIASFATEEISLLKQAWSLLDPTQQAALFTQFETRFNAIDTYVKDKGADPMGIARTQAKEQADIIAAAVKTAVAEALAQPASDISTAAENIQAAADTPVVSNVTVTIKAPAGLEVSP